MPKKLGIFPFLINIILRMRDEFTKEMHAEFFVPKELEISHSVRTVILHTDLGFSLEDSLKIYGVSKVQYDKYKSEWQQ